MNGTDTFAEMTARIEAIRRRTGSALVARPHDYDVGCIMISQPAFFARDDWVADHADWHPRIRGGKTIDVSRGDGQRILAECLERAARLRPEADPLTAEVCRYGAPQVVQPRLGHGTFRIAVTSAYGACAALGRALAARAPRPRTCAPTRRAACTRSPTDYCAPTSTASCDAGYVTVTPDHRFHVSHDLADDFRRRPRVRALRRPRHHRAANADRSARSRAARLARGRGVPRLSVTHHGRSSSLCDMAAPATLQDGMNGIPQHSGDAIILHHRPHGQICFGVRRGTSGAGALHWLGMT